MVRCMRSDCFDNAASKTASRLALNLEGHCFVASVTVTSASTTVAGELAGHAAAQVSGATALMDALRRHGVDTIFGYPGGAILPILWEKKSEVDRHRLKILFKRFRKKCQISQQ